MPEDQAACERLSLPPGCFHSGGRPVLSGPLGRPLKQTQRSEFMSFRNSGFFEYDRRLPVAGAGELDLLEAWALANLSSGPEQLRARSSFARSARQIYRLGFERVTNREFILLVAQVHRDAAEALGFRFLLEVSQFHRGLGSSASCEFQARSQNLCFQLQTFVTMSLRVSKDLAKEGLGSFRMSG